MKAKPEQIFNAAITLMAAYLTDENIELDSFHDTRINCFIELAKRTAELIPDGTPRKRHDTSKLFVDFPWKKEGVTRTEMEKWLKEHSGYTSNRAMQTIINNALADGIIHKDMKVGRYFPGRDNSHA